MKSVSLMFLLVFCSGLSIHAAASSVPVRRSLTASPKPARTSLHDIIRSATKCDDLYPHFPVDDIDTFVAVRSVAKKSRPVNLQARDEDGCTVLQRIIRADNVDNEYVQMLGCLLYKQFTAEDAALLRMRKQDIEEELEAEMAEESVHRSELTIQSLQMKKAALERILSACTARAR